MEATAEYGVHGYVKDHFAVDDLLALPCDDYEEAECALAGTGAAALAGGGGTAMEEDGGFGNASADSSTVTAMDSCSNSSFDLADGDFTGRFCEPYEQLAELEWVSNYMVEGYDDAFPSEDLQKLHLISGIRSSNAPPAPAVPVASPEPQPGVFLPEAPVPAKARSKRSRAAPSNWSSHLLVLPPTPASPPSPAPLAISPAESSVSAGQAFQPKRPAKPATKKKDAPAARPASPLAVPGASAAAGEGRRCLHCETDKTPQWRTGPMGPKTLCNACGVRYKSGRLVPEYRPAASPTFVVTKHSNSHRKVLELRRKSEMPHAGVGAGSMMHMQSPLLFDGPSGPPIVAGEDFLIHHRLETEFRQLI